jgi:hypothetical protein
MRVAEFTKAVSSVNQNWHSVLIQNGVQYLNFGQVAFANANPLLTTNPMSVSTNAQGIAASGEACNFITEPIPIAEFANSAVAVSQVKPEYSSNNTASSTNSDNSTNFVYGPDGSFFPGTLTSAYLRRVRFLTPHQVGDKFELQVQISATGPWFPFSAVGGDFKVVSAAGTGARPLAVSGSSTDVDVQFSRYIYDTTNWGTGDKWRLARFPGATQVSSPTTVKYQRKILAADYAGTNGAFITFNNLTVGKTYRVTADAIIFQDDDDLQSELYVKNGSTEILRFEARHQDQADPLTQRVTFSKSVVFQATNATLTFVTGDFSVDSIVYGTSSGSYTSMTVEELSTHTPTTEWT